MLSYIVAALLIALTLYVLFGNAASSNVKCALDPDKFKGFKLVEKFEVSPDAWIFRFALHTPTQRLGLPIGNHIYLRAAIQNPEGKSEVVQHAYTPISSDDDLGHVDYLIKVYHKNVHPKFPNGGRLSQHLYNLPIGSTVEMRGPVGKFEYLGNGNCTIGDGKGGARRIHVDTFAMVAGGTGITPMMQLIRAIMKSPNDPTKVFLVFANNTESDILLRKELDECTKDPRVHVWYTIAENAPEGWRYSTGFVTEEMLRAHLPVLQPPEEKHGRVLAVACGPPVMLQMAVKPNLQKMGYADDDIFSF
ncbi:putative NADH-cytochrome b5 reductase [Trypanosoma grayi]|uniref:putative NADH-cytochrome b5 reductase n=1 Tax=Trypanosoma grayi TaxID=71804 RepID=UPI0004F452CB|nr:putative NADH-cytochrome b5 reductase [Trypanosoma grayi]KEG10949.1 putative NADH-cytochrome b5 reductase [Trypanosoma grayi]